MPGEELRGCAGVLGDSQVGEQIYSASCFETITALEVAARTLHYMLEERRKD